MFLLFTIRLLLSAHHTLCCTLNLITLLKSTLTKDSFYFQTQKTAFFFFFFFKWSHGEPEWPPLTKRRRHSVDLKLKLVLIMADITQGHIHTHTHTHTHGAQALSHILIRFHGNPDWDHIACPSICSVLTCVVFVFFCVCVCVCVCVCF